MTFANSPDDAEGLIREPKASQTLRTRRATRRHRRSPRQQRQFQLIEILDHSHQHIQWILNNRSTFVMYNRWVASLGNGRGKAGVRIDSGPKSDSFRCSPQPSTPQRSPVISRNLDIGALRSLVAIADAKGVTRAAERINLSQSAVSMQIRRLEEAFGSKLLMRQGRGVVLTANGEQLVSYARRLVRLNDDAWMRLTADELEGELRFGVPADIVYPHVPYVLRQAREAYPRIKITLVSDVTLALKEQLDHGALDLILTTERRLEERGETLLEAPLQWIGKTGGTAHLRRPLPMALCSNCALKPDLLIALDSASIPWEIVAETDSDAAVDATVAADLAVKPVVGTHYGVNQMPVPATSLPSLPPVQVNLYTSEDALVTKLAELVRVAYSMSAEELGEAELIDRKVSVFR